jgi:hypothetical protein
MNLTYLLKEGFIDIRFTEKDLTTFSRRVQVRLNNTPFCRIIDTNMGKAIVYDRTGEMLIIDTASVEKFGAPLEVLINTPLLTANDLQSLKE